MIVAMCRNRGIGYDNGLPWKLRKDMKYFKRMTIGDGNNCVIMGKNTWYSLRTSITEPLPKRDKIIMSSKNIEIAKIHAKKSGLKIKYINTSPEKKKLSEKYDVILNLEIVEHVENLDLFLKSASDLLKKNGRGGFVSFVTAGDPDFDTSLNIVKSKEFSPICHHK